MSPLVVESVIDARLHGAIGVPLNLTYRVADPAAIGLWFIASRGPLRWLASREALRDGLDVDRAVAYAGEAAARVHLSTRPGAHHALLVLRASDRARWPLTVPVAPLRSFIEASYIACTVEREARIVTDELHAQLGFLAMTQGGAA